MRIYKRNVGHYNQDIPQYIKIDKSKKVTQWKKRRVFNTIKTFQETKQIGKKIDETKQCYWSFEYT